MAFERNNAAEDFETMVRQHLARSGRITADCAGFDAETLSAYLEGALSPAARVRAEEHLAACSGCRHDLIELRRLMPAAEVQKVPAPSRHPLFGWLQTLRDGLRAQGQGWRWGMLAAAGACVALASISVLLVRREGISTLPAAGHIAMSRPSPDATPQAVLVEPRENEPQRVVPSSRPSTAVGAQRSRIPAGDTAGAAQGGRTVGGLGGSQSTISAVNAISGRVSDSGGAAIVQAQVTLADAASQQARASTQTDARGQFNFNDLPGGDYRVTVQAQGFKSQQIANVRSDVRQELSVKLDPGDSAQSLALLSPSAKASATENEKQESVKRDAPKALDSISASSGTAEGKDRPPRQAGAYGLATRGGAGKAKRPQPTPTPARSTEDENFHALTRKVRDKTFRFDRSIWIDQDYKPENALPRARLTRGSAEFDRVLNDIPALAPFFDLGQVIVVWQNKVYEVRK